MGQWEGKVQTFAYPLFQRITLVPAALKHATDKFKNTLWLMGTGDYAK
jgi:hypothetical protein